MALFKLVLISVVFISYMGISDSVINLWYNDIFFTRIHINSRSKRAVDDSSYCLKECLNKMRELMKQKMTEQEKSNNNGIINVDLSMALDLPVFCPNIYKPIKTCIDKCPFDTSNYVVSAGFGPLNYMCIDNYTDAISAWPCADKALNGMKAECQRPCRRINSTPNTGGGSLKSNLTATYTLNCKVSECEWKCQIPKLQSQCSAKSVKFIQGLTKSGFDSAHKINSAVIGKQDAPWPQECSSLQKLLA